MNDLLKEGVGVFLDPDDPGFDSHAALAWTSLVSLGQKRRKQLMQFCKDSSDSTEIRIPNTFIGYGSGFSDAANYQYFKEKYQEKAKFLHTTQGPSMGFDPDDVPEEVKTLEVYLAKIPDDTWDEFMDDVKTVVHSGDVDPDLRQELVMKEQERWWKEDGHPDLLEALLPRFPNSLVQFEISLMDVDYTRELMSKYEMYPEEDGEGSVWMKVEDLAAKIDEDDIRGGDDEAEMRKDFEQVKQQALAETTTVEPEHYIMGGGYADNPEAPPQSALERFGRALDRASHDTPAAHHRLSDMEAKDLMAFLDAVLPEDYGAKGTNFAWKACRVRLGDGVSYLMRVMPVDAETHKPQWPEGNLAKKQADALQALAQEPRTLHALAHWRQGEGHPELKLEAKEPDMGDPEGDLSFEQAKQWMYAHSADAFTTLFQDQYVKLTVPLNEYTVRKYRPSHDGSGGPADTMYFAFLSNDEEVDVATGNVKRAIGKMAGRKVVTIYDNGDRLTTGLYFPEISDFDRVYGNFGKSLLKALAAIYHKRALKELKAQEEYEPDYREYPEVKKLFQIVHVSPKLTASWGQRLKPAMVPHLDFRLGIMAAERGDAATASVYWDKYPVENITPQGVLIKFEDWGDTTDMFSAEGRHNNYRERAEQVFGEGVREWFDHWEAPQLSDVIDDVDEDSWKLVREALLHREITLNGRTFYLTKQDLDNLDDRDLRDIIKDPTEYEIDVDDIQMAIRHGAQNAVEDGYETAYYNGYIKTIEDELGPALVKSHTDASGKVHTYKQPVFTVSYKRLRELEIDFENENNDTFDGSPKDLVLTGLKLKPNDEYEGDWSADNFNYHLHDYQLTELEPGVDPELPPDEPNPNKKEIHQVYNEYYPNGATVQFTLASWQKFQQEKPQETSKEAWDAYAKQHNIKPKSPVGPAEPPMEESLFGNLIEGSAYKYATTQIDIPPEQADVIWQWGYTNIPDDALEAENGREHEQHVTVKYGLLADETPPLLRQLGKEFAAFPVYIGKVSLFRNERFDVVKLDVESPWLRRLNARISAELPNEDSYPDYHPHITVAYVQKGKADHLEGVDIFANAAEAGVSAEFLAAGFKFKGATDDADKADRVVETILFSKVNAKPPEPDMEPEPEPEAATVEALDPFADLPFPADPSRTKAFLRMWRTRPKPITA